MDNSKLTEDDSITEELSLKERLENFMDAKPYMIFIIVMTVLSVIQGAISMFNTSCEGDSEFMKLYQSGLVSSKQQLLIKNSSSITQYYKFRHNPLLGHESRKNSGCF